MVAFGPSMFCADAERYYYDYLHPLGTGVPQAVSEHIRICVHCRTQIRQLEAAVGASEAQARQPRGKADIVGVLGLHFAHIGQDVTCAKAKSLLPTLLVPSPAIRIPTPITVHTDHCGRCAENLESLRELELRPEQLTRLSHLYASAVAGDRQTCRRAGAKTWAVACASFEGIDAAVLDHICTCPRCRRRVYRCRQRILTGRQPGDRIPGLGLCDELSMADLFDWVVPYGRGDDLESSPVRDEATASHLRACPDCIERAQALHQVIFGMAEQVDSSVSTVYTTTTGVGEPENCGCTPNLYSGYPIHVEAMHREPVRAVSQLPSLAPALAGLRGRLVRLHSRPVARAAMLAAAMIPLAVVLLVNTRSASGVSVREIWRTVKQVENLHVVTYNGDETANPAREIWASRHSDWLIRKDENGQSLFDNKQHLHVAIHPDGTTETTKLTRDESVGTDEVLDRLLGFADTDIPSDMRSVLLTREPASDVEDHGEAYELTWSDKSTRGHPRLTRLRVVVDSATGRPAKTKFYRRLADEEEWVLGTTRVFTYPTETEMQLKAAELRRAR